MRISDWSSDVCSSDLLNQIAVNLLRNRARAAFQQSVARQVSAEDVPLPANDMIAEVEARDVLNRVGAAMARLSPKTREIFMAHQIGRAHVCTPVTNAHLVCRLLLENKNKTTTKITT